ncbi:hypothetical protein Cassandra_0226 [Pseudomonas phage Cassandra]|uniref:Uncharacterized protein n=1 Tax=Pseudomonas phage vB_PaeM_PA5oct TaxID=2163605 RepID=A0A4Y5JUF0_9CAUD|nr:hypothetical protein PQE65_gp069 [Pseudomonas phage vB_PaeM_PA5oct]QCG76296.1 hypothetical protein EST35_0428 [Pseudomonas phage vB_PaeM_PA5oct]WPK38902.1 hypothetical protein Cassandra_0226 [Pseudomonas phage Cassandra]
MDNIKSCKCAHDFQDSVYGKGNRVHNVFTKGYRCTVCGKEIITSSTGKK